MLNSLPNWELSNGLHAAELLLGYVCAACRVLHSVEKPVIRLPGRVSGGGKNKRLLRE